MVTYKYCGFLIIRNYEILENRIQYGRSYSGESVAMGCSSPLDNTADRVRQWCFASVIPQVNSRRDRTTIKLFSKAASLS